MNILKTTALSTAQKEGLLHLWNNEYPAVIAHADVESLDGYLHTIHNAQHQFVIENDRIIGWLCEFERENKRWFAVIVDRSSQGMGLGTQLMKSLTTRPIYGWILKSAGAKRADGSPYPNPRSFYENMGFIVEDDIELEKDGIQSVRIKKLH